ncbi:MAG: hypothetical protein AAGF87_00080 [Bacteroidota bacterium]
MKLSPDSRIWIYAAERRLRPAEVQLAQQTASAFVQQWGSHGRPLEAEASVLHDRFLILAVDQRSAGASGCSIDASVHFVQRLGAELGVDFFNRMVFHYRDEKGEVHSLSRADFAESYRTGLINELTVVFDPLIDSVGALVDGFEKPLSKSWHANMV